MAAPLGRCCCRALVQNKRVYLYRAFSGSHAALLQTQAKPSSSGTQKIVIPKRKQRNAVSILEALASTVSKDYDAPHFRYIDDPFLIPASSMSKREYSLSLASGQRAAEYVMANYPRGFLNNPAEPSIEAFLPQTPHQHPEDSLAGLEERIDRRQPLLAFQSRQALKEAGVNVPVETLVQLLELLCYYNSEDPDDKCLPEEEFFHHYVKQSTLNTWKNKGLAEQLFKELPEKTPAAYLALLKGRAKFFDAYGVSDLFAEMSSLNAGICVDAYNTMLRMVAFLKEDGEEHWNIIQELLDRMVSQKIAPNLDTFNSILFSLHRMKYNRRREVALQVIQEMKDIGIEPSLASWYYVIRMIYSADDVTSDILSDIIDYLQGKELVGQETADYSFFSVAMGRCYNHQKDLDLAYRIDKLLNTGKNFHLVGNSIRQGFYFSDFLFTLCTFEQIDKLMENYERITPHVYTPGFNAFDELLRAIELNEGYKYLPQVWSDLVLFDYARRPDLVEHVLRIMAKKKHEPELQSIFLQIALSVSEKVEEEKLVRRANRFKLTGVMVGDLIQISIHSDDFAAAQEFFKVYQDNKLDIEKFPSENSLVSFSEACIEKKETELVLQCLQLMADFAYPKVDHVALKITKGLELNEDQKNFIDDLL